MFDLLFNIVCLVFIIIGLSSVIVYALPVPKDKTYSIKEKEIIR